MTSSVESAGRVVRLHFTCHAELPIGSYLRVTGSTLWAPGSSALDPSDAGAAWGQASTQGFAVNEESDHPSLGDLYTSSVEMVTSPETYPVWRTKHPVIVVLHKKHQHHYYRYLVVSPGGTYRGGFLDEDEEDLSNSYDVIASTSNEDVGVTPVMQWEDPFGVLQGKDQGQWSALSLASSGADTHVLTQTNYRNLPYRTLDIDISGAVEQRMDHWNQQEDESFRPYMIRDAINQENRSKMEASLPESKSNDAIPERSIGDATPPSFSTANRVFFVCFHLPVVVVQNQQSGEWRASWSESILARTEGSQIVNTYESYWVGTVTTHPPLQTDDDKEKVRKLLEEMNCIPLFLDPAMRQAHYYGFCKQVLWPAFHNIDLLDLSTCGWLTDPDSGASDWDQSRLDNWWNSYITVNKEFSKVMTGLTRQGDIVWIHDYHLSLLPQAMVEHEKEKFGFKVTRKVFFLHIPFPTSQIFRELECGEFMLQGMLHADVVGFHAFDHARHFLNAAKRILGLNYESLVGGLIGVSYQGSTVLVSMSNVSIEPRILDAALMLPSVKSGAESLRQKHAGRQVIAGVDIGQKLSGISLKLLAYERLLQDYPSYQSKVALIQRVLLPGSRQLDEKSTASEVRALVKRIEQKFGPEVIDYQELVGSSLPMDQRLAVWKATDVLMITPIREGLNHWPMEYIYTHKEPEKPGIVIASEFSAISSILNGALRCNPFDIQMLVSTIDKALSMERPEREGRRYRDIDFVSNSPSDKWVKNVLRDLRDATSRQTRGSESSSATSTPHGGTQTPLRKELIDCTAAFLAQENNHAFTHLSMKALRRSFNASHRRVIITDFNGTIVLKEPPGKYLKREILGTSGNKPPQDVIEALSQLSMDPKNMVYVVSGDSTENVLNALGHLPRVGLAVSNGARFSPPMQPGETDRKWFTFDLGVDWDAVKKVALPVLSKYTARSNGSFVKLTSFSIGWSYYSCDPEWGSLQAAHLVMELEHALRAYDVRFVTLKGIVEVVPRKLNKGLIVKKVLQDASTVSEEGVDFVLCLGDDISDEKMFTSVFSFLSEVGADDALHKPGPRVVAEDGTVEEPFQTTSKLVMPETMYSHTVAVGKKATHANTYVNDAQDVANALVMLAQGQIPEGGVPVWGNESSSRLFA